MKALTTDGFPASIIFFFLSISTHIANIAALTIPTRPSIQPANISHILPLLFPAINTTSLNANHYNYQCVPQSEEATWYNDHVHSKWRYDTPCYESMVMFSKEQSTRGDNNFEFLAPGAKATTKLKTMQTPRRYSYGSYPIPSCSVIVAMLDFLSPGQLPGQPEGPFRPTDVATFEELIDAGGEVFAECIRAPGPGLLPDLHFGWTRAGRGGNIGIFFTGTKSQIDRSIPRGIHP